MAFRIEAAAVACLIAWPLAAQEYRVKQGMLRVSDSSIEFEQKDRVHEWKLGDIRQLTLGNATVRVQTYEGRNRQYTFTLVPKALADKWYPVFREKLDQRFVAALADDSVAPEWRLSAKLRRNVEGEIVVGADRIVFRATRDAESRTWRIGDIESIASAGRFDFTITTREKEFHFDLKEALSEAHYQELWFKVNRAQGLRILP